MTRKILVTGGTGFTGRALCERLVRDGEQVVAFVRPTSDTGELSRLGVEIRRLDLADERAVQENFEPFKRVFHIAAAFRTEHDQLDEFRRANVTVTRCLIEAAQRFQCGRFVHCSTVGVQGEIDDPPADETYRYKPGDFYQQSKMEGELLVLDYFRRGFAGSIVRPVGIYGPGDTRFLKLFKPIARGKFIMIGSGRVLYHLTFIDDLIQGFILAGEKDAAVGEVFTIGGPRYTTLEELVKMISQVTGGPPVRWRIPYAPVHAAAVLCSSLSKVLHIKPILYPRRVEFFKKPRAFKIDKARRLLGYEPKVDLLDGLTRTANWYREQGWI